MKLMINNPYLRWDVVDEFRVHVVTCRFDFK